METAIPEGNRIFYNFTRPHMALEGQTPAQAAGINLELEGTKWLELIRLANARSAKSPVVELHTG